MKFQLTLGITTLKNGFVRYPPSPPCFCNVTNRSDSRAFPHLSRVSFFITATSALSNGVPSRRRMS